MVVDYTIPANPIADRGTKTVYIIIKKGSETIGDENSTFEIDGGKQLQYTLKEDVKYDGKEAKRSPSYNLTNNLDPGSYTVEVYLDNRLFSSSSFDLR